MKKRLQSEKNMLKKKKTNIKKEIKKSSCTASKTVKLFRFTNNEVWIKTYISRIINL